MDSKRKTQTAGPDASDKAVHWRAEILFSSIIMKDGSPIGDDARTPPVAGGHMACAQLQRGQAAFALCALEFFRAKAARQYDIADMILDGAWANAARGRLADMSPDRPDPRTRLH